MGFITDFIYRYGLIAMFVLILAEYACFPVSSEIVLPLSGAVASYQNIPFLLILPLSILAGLLGTSLCYLVGYYGGTSLLDKINKKFPKTKKGIDSSFERFNQHGSITVCVGRMIPLCRTYIAFVAGAAKQPYSIFFFSSSIGIALWNTLLIGIGYFLRENWKFVLLWYEQYKHVLFIFIVCVVSILLIRKGMKK